MKNETRGIISQIKDGDFLSNNDILNLMRREEKQDYIHGNVKAKD